MAYFGILQSSRYRSYGSVASEERRSRARYACRQLISARNCLQETRHSAFSHALTMWASFETRARAPPPWSVHLIRICEVTARWRTHARMHVRLLSHISGSRDVGGQPRIMQNSLALSGIVMRTKRDFAAHRTSSSPSNTDM